MKLHQYQDHFMVAFLGCPVKRSVVILWGKTFFKVMKAIVTIITYYTLLMTDISTVYY
jgi:hypothetical protein